MESIEFICLGSGSSGNCYLFKKNNQCVVVECGLDFKTIIKGMMTHNISLSDIVGVVVSHQHKDHSKALNDFIEAGVNVYIPNSLVGLEMSNMPNVKCLDGLVKYDMCSWLKLTTFKTEHDVESYGFCFMDLETKESILFITDTKCFDFLYKGYSFDYIFIECNHIRKQLEVVLQKALDNGKSGEVVKYKRQAEYHLSLAGCKKFLSFMNLSKTKGIFLIHLSQEVCNDVIIKNEITSVFNIRTLVCYKKGGIN